MRYRPFTRAVATLCLVSVIASCANTRVPPITSAGAAFTPERDEKRLWDQSREEERKLLEKVKVYQDPLLVDYLGEVVQRLNPPAMAANPAISYKVTVLEDPTLNAFAYPTGSLYVHTGILARMENEDQLATVFGHEMTHVEGRHLLRHHRSARNKQIGFSLAAIAGAVIIAGEEGQAAREGHYGKAARTRVLSDVLVGLGLQLIFIAAVNGYGRDLEREADEGGFTKMAGAGYDVAEAPKVYQTLLDDHGEPSKVEAFFFGSHPRLKERVENAKSWNGTHPAATRAEAPSDPDAFARRIRPVVRDDARLNIELGRLQLAEDELLRVMALPPEDPEAHALLGALKLKRAEAQKDREIGRRLRDEAMRAFEESIRLAPDRPAPHRELGLIAYRNGDYRTACEQFKLYLELDPRAEDAERIRDYRLELTDQGRCP